MTTSALRLAILVFFTAAGVSSADAHDEAGHAKTLENLGDVAFETSCERAVHETFEIGIALVHSYAFKDARAAFESALDKDPRCAMAHWGIALAFAGDPLVGPPPARDLAAGAQALARARALSPGTARERDWIATLDVLYRTGSVADYERALERLSRAYPDDLEAQVFHALASIASGEPRAPAVLERLFARHPRHPGIAHYLIHAYAATPSPEKGLAVALRYPSIAPAAPHALHMPAHICARLGQWKETIAANIAALEARHDDYVARDWLVYAYLQLGQLNRARAFADHVLTLVRDGRWADVIGAGSLETHLAASALPARYALEREDWKAAAKLPIVSSEFPQADALLRFARGMGMARSGDVAGARVEIAALRELARKCADPYWARRIEDQALAVTAWVARAEGDDRRAIESMRAAADSEDGDRRHPAMANRLWPMHELLGELLIEMGKGGAALRELDTARRNDPNRARGLRLAVRAASVSDPARAEDFRAQLKELLREADVP